MSELLEAAREMAQDLYQVGAMDEITMCQIDILCLSSAEAATNTEKGRRSPKNALTAFPWACGRLRRL